MVRRKSEAALKTLETTWLRLQIGVDSKVFFFECVSLGKNKLDGEKVRNISRAELAELGR